MASPSLRLSLLLGLVLCLFVLVHASQMVARNAIKPTMKVGKIGSTQIAVISYKVKKGKKVSQVNAMVWGAVDFRPYSKTKKQAAFKVNNAGGFKSPWGSGSYAKVKNQCVHNAAIQAALPLCIYACTMPDGSHWAMQVWQRGLPNMGVKPTKAVQTSFELHASHWTTKKTPVLWMKVGWQNYSQIYDHMYGTFSAGGVPVYGASSTAVGNPLDTYGRNIYVDLQNAAWTAKGAHTQPGGWIRWNGFLAHRPKGNFCASVFPKLFGVKFPDFQVSTGFRAFAMGPGVTPIAGWVGPPPGVGNYETGGFPPGNFYAQPPVQAHTLHRTPYNPQLSAELAKEQQSTALPSDECHKIHP